MLDISKLERRWLQYKLKSILPYSLAIITLITLVISFPFIFSKTAIKMPLPSEKKITLKTTTSIVEKNESIDSAMILEPSMQFMQTMETPLIQNTIQATSVTTIVPKINSSSTKQIPQSASLPKTTKTEVLKPEITPVSSIQTSAKEKVSSVKKGDVAFNIHEIEERFKNNSNANLGLYIAHYHYEHGNYAEAYNYALRTNAINNSLDENWLIFAKSLVKLGKKDQAKKTLQLYISNSNSDSAKSYLDILNKENDK